MRFFYVFIIFILLMMAYSCRENGLHSVKELKWLEGTWYKPDGDVVYKEIWVYRTDSLTGAGMTIQSGLDTLFYENLKIITKEGQLCYLARVPSQNNGQWITFRLTSAGSNRFVFANYDHDFPNQIIYTLIDSLKLKTTVKGSNDDKREFSIEFVKDKSQNPLY